MISYNIIQLLKLRNLTNLNLQTSEQFAILSIWAITNSMSFMEFTEVCGIFTEMFENVRGKFGSLWKIGKSWKFEESWQFMKAWRFI